MNVKRSVKSISVMQTSASVLHHAHFTGTLGHCEELGARSRHRWQCPVSGVARCAGPHHVSHADLSSIRLVLDNWSWFYSLSLHWDFTGPVCGFIQMSMPVPNLLWVHFLHFSWTLVLRKRICLAVSEMKHCVLACKLPGSHLANGNFTEKSTLFISFYFVSK